jgi:hypothetical protein
MTAADGGRRRRQIEETRRKDGKPEQAWGARGTEPIEVAPPWLTRNGSWNQARAGNASCEAVRAPARTKSSSVYA